MKKTFIYLPVAVFTLFFTACSEKKLSPSEVPAAVTTSFSAKYPGATDVEWERENEDNKAIYEVEAEVNGKGIKAKFDESGNLISQDDD